MKEDEIDYETIPFERLEKIFQALIRQHNEIGRKGGTSTLQNEIMRIQPIYVRRKKEERENHKPSVSEERGIE